MDNKRLIKIIGFVIACVFLASISFFMIFNATKRQATSPSIISSNFIGYDLARVVTGSTDDLKMLLKPGGEAHSFEPTPQDIIDITKADLFIYIGGESDDWVTEILEDNQINEKRILKLMDYVEVKEEILVEGMETVDEVTNTEELEYDEHIWTSPLNVIKIVEAIATRLAELYPDNAEVYQQHTANYVAQLKTLDEQFRNVVAAASQRELVFGDRFPFRYLVDEYGLDYYAAFPGCAEQTEASSQTIAFLIDKVKTNNIKVVLKTEMTNGQLAQTIAEETGAEVLVLSAAHNVSQEDFEQGITYLTIMQQNLNTLQKALQ